MILTMAEMAGVTMDDGGEEGALSVASIAPSILGLKEAAPTGMRVEEVLGPYRRSGTRPRKAPTVSCSP